MQWSTPPAPFRWLNGTPVIPALYAAAEGPKILRKVGNGCDSRAKHRADRRASSSSPTSHGFTVNAPRDPAQRGGTVAIDVPHGYEVTQHLLSRDILVDYRVGAGIRIAPHFFTRDEEIEAVVSRDRQGSREPEAGSVSRKERRS